MLETAMFPLNELRTWEYAQEKEFREKVAKYIIPELRFALI